MPHHFKPWQERIHKYAKPWLQRIIEYFYPALAPKLFRLPPLMVNWITGSAYKPVLNQSRMLKALESGPIHFDCQIGALAFDPANESEEVESDQDKTLSFERMPIQLSQMSFKPFNSAFSVPSYRGDLLSDDVAKQLSNHIDKCGVKFPDTNIDWWRENGWIMEKFDAMPALIAPYRIASYCEIPIRHPETFPLMLTAPEYISAYPWHANRIVLGTVQEEFPLWFWLVMTLWSIVAIGGWLGL